MILNSDFGSLHNFLATGILKRVEACLQLRNHGGKQVDAELRPQYQVVEFGALAQGLQSTGLKTGIDERGLHAAVAGKVNKAVDLAPLRLHEQVALARCEPQGIAAWREAQVGIVLPQQYAVLGTAGKHAVGFVDTLGHEVVDEHTYVGLVAGQYKGGCTHGILVGVDASHKALPCCFLIARGAIHLPGKEEILHQLGLKVVLELRGVEVVVLDGIAWAVGLHMCKGRYLAQGIELDAPRHRRREAVEIHFIGALALGLNKELVGILVGEGDQLGLDAGAVTGPYRLNLTVEQGRLGQAGAQHVVHLTVGPHDVARPLAQLAVHSGQEREVMKVVVALLHRSLREIDGAGVETHRGARLHAAGGKAQRTQLLGDAVRRRLGHSPTLHFYRAHMHEPVEEGAGGEYNSLGGEVDPKSRGHAVHLAVGDVEFHGTILPHVQVGGVLNRVAPVHDKAHAVGLGARTPHGWALRPVEHAKLQARAVGNDAHLPAKCIYLPHNLPFGNATHGGIATHLGNFVHIDSYEQGRRAQVGCSTCGLAASMAGTNHYHIEIVDHYVSKNVSRKNCKCLILMTFHDFALTRALVVDAAQVQHAMHNHAHELVAIVGSILRGIAAHGVERNHHVAAYAVAIAVVEGDDVGIVVVTQVLLVGGQDVVIVAEHISQAPHPLAVMGSNLLQPFTHGLAVENRHLYILSYVIHLNHCLSFLATTKLVDFAHKTLI